MAMDSTSATLACYLLAISFAVVQTQKQNLTITPAVTTPGLNLTHTTPTLSSYNSTVPTTVISNSSENAVFTSTTRDTEPLTTTAATTQSTSLLRTSQSTTIVSPQTDSTSLTTTTPGAPTSTALTTQTTVGYISTADTTVITTNSSHTGNATTDSIHTTTQGLRLNISEEAMTIVFSVVLGVFALALVAFMFHRCKHKIQYLHQPLNDTGDTADAFVADDDTLVISGGLYDDHPIYDNVPTVPADRSQFRLQFLH